MDSCKKVSDLRIAAKNEEKRLLELRRRLQYLSSKPRPAFDGQKKTSDETQGQQQETAYQLSRSRPRRCHICSSTSHLKRDCKATKTESTVLWGAKVDKNPFWFLLAIYCISDVKNIYRKSDV